MEECTNFQLDGEDSPSSPQFENSGTYKILIGKFTRRIFPGGKESENVQLEGGFFPIFPCSLIYIMCIKLLMVIQIG